MADGGIGEAALLSAAIGGGMSAVQGRDPLQGALMGGLLGGAGAGLFGGAEGLAGETVLDAGGNQLISAGTAGQAPVYDALGNVPGTVTPVTGATSLTGTPLQSANISPYSDFGQANPFASAAPTTNGIVGYQGGENVLQNQLGATVGAPPVNPDVMANGIGGSGTSLLSSPAAGAATTSAAGNTGISNLIDKAGSFLPETTAGRVALGGGLGLAALMAQERNKYGVPAAEKYTGPLSKFSYNPSTYQPDVVRPPNPVYRAQYAGGGPVEMMSNQNAMGANTMYPMANMTTSAFATPYQDPRATNMMSAIAPSGGGTVDVMSGESSMQGTRLAGGGSIQHYDIGGEIGGAFNSIGNGIGSALGGVNNLITNAGQGRISLADQPGTMSYDDPRFKAHLEAMLQGKQPPQYASGGGISSLGSYSDGGRMLKGPGDGMSDSIPAKIGERQPARLADSEFVVPADVVSHLGNGSSDAGAKQLYKMMDRVRKARTGTEKQGRQIQPSKYIPA
jgi:hypothetical protein